MNPEEKLTELLTGKQFSHEGEKFAFVSCKKVFSNIMVLTNKKTLQIPLDRFADFYQKVGSNCEDFSVVEVMKKELVAAEAPVGKVFELDEIPVKNQVTIMPEVPKVFEKLNESFESLIEQINSASESDLKSLEIRGRMLTSVAQTAVNMENSRISLIKMLNR